MAPRTNEQKFFGQALGEVDFPVQYAIANMPIELTHTDVEGLVPSIVKTEDNDAKPFLMLKTYGTVSDAGDDDSLEIGKYRIIRDLSQHNPFLTGDKSNERYFVVTELTPAQVGGIMQTVAKERLALKYQAIRDAAAEAAAELVNRQTSTLAPGVLDVLDQMEDVKEAADQAARDLEAKAEKDAEAHAAKLEAALEAIVARLGGNDQA